MHDVPTNPQVKFVSFLVWKLYRAKKKVSVLNDFFGRSSQRLYVQFSELYLG